MNDVFVVAVFHPRLDDKLHCNKEVSTRGIYKTL